MSATDMLRSVVQKCSTDVGCGYGTDIGYWTCGTDIGYAATSPHPSSSSPIRLCRYQAGAFHVLDQQSFDGKKFITGTNKDGATAGAAR
eukprot:2064266-Rhodomonas_salina.1